MFNYLVSAFLVYTFLTWQYFFNFIVSWFSLVGHQVPTKAAPSLHLLSWTGEKKYDERLLGRDKDMERSLTNYHHGQNRLDLGKLV